MKRKAYKITIKLVFEDTMIHSQTSMKKAIEEVKMVATDYFKDKFKDNEVINPNRIICKAEKYEEESFN